MIFCLELVDFSIQQGSLESLVSLCWEKRDYGRLLAMFLRARDQQYQWKSFENPDIDNQIKAVFFDLLALGRWGWGELKEDHYHALLGEVDRIKQVKQSKMQDTFGFLPMDYFFWFYPKSSKDLSSKAKFSEHAVLRVIFGSADYAFLNNILIYQASQVDAKKYAADLTKIFNRTTEDPDGSLRIKTGLMPECMYPENTRVFLEFCEKSTQDPKNLRGSPIFSYLLRTYYCTRGRSFEQFATKYARTLSEDQKKKLQALLQEDGLDENVRMYIQKLDLTQTPPDFSKPVRSKDPSEAEAPNNNSPSPWDLKTLQECCQNKNLYLKILVGPDSNVASLMSYPNFRLDARSAGMQFWRSCSWTEYKRLLWDAMVLTYEDVSNWIFGSVKLSLDLPKARESLALSHQQYQQIEHLLSASKTPGPALKP